MKLQRHGRTTWIAGLWLLAVFAAAPAVAQDGPGSLPQDIVTTTRPFSQEQKRIVNAYVGFWADRLVNAERGGGVAQGRRALLEPFTRPGATATFKDQYSALLITPIKPGATAERVIIRLNTMILVANSYGAYGVDLAAGRLDDKSPAVRYWAAAAIAEAVNGAAERQGLPTARQRQLFRAIRGVLTNESACDVREKLYQAMAAMDIAEAQAALLEALDERADVYAREGLTACLRAERQGLKTLRLVLIEKYIAAGDQQQKLRAARQQLRELSIVSYRYVALVARAITEEGLADDTKAIAGDLVGLVQLVLRETVNAYNGQGAAKPNFVEPFENDRPLQFKLAVLDWVDVLKAEPMSVPAERLNLPARRNPEGDGGGDNTEAAVAGDGEPANP